MFVCFVLFLKQNIFSSSLESMTVDHYGYSDQAFSRLELLTEKSAPQKLNQRRYLLLLSTYQKDNCTEREREAPHGGFKTQHCPSLPTFAGLILACTIKPMPFHCPIFLKGKKISATESQKIKTHDCFQRALCGLKHKES